MNFMRLLKEACFALLLALTVQLNGADQTIHLITMPGSRVVIDGGNNVHEWQIQGEVIDGTAECGPGFPVTTNQRVRLGDVQGELEGSIPVRSLHHGSKAMDRIVYHALKEERNPRIRFRFEELTLTRRPTANDAAFLFDADSELVVAGVTNLSRIPITLRPLGNEQLRITGVLKLRMTDFAIKPPEAKGADFTIQTRDEVQVSFDWLVGPKPRQAVRATNPVPPFVAEGSISTSNRFSATEAKFSFFSSNGWWQLDLTNFTTPPQYKSQDCMSIPGGVRHYTMFESIGNSALAAACPIDYPPPGIAGGMFQTWLCLCPNPKLPVIDGKRMHRFLMVPSAPFDVLKDSLNQGEYLATYLEPGRVFLSALTITNDGVRINWDPEKNEVWRFPAPFDSGFRELAYQVLESTNIHGIAFPLRAVFQQFGPDPEHRNQLSVVMDCEIKVSRISFAPTDLSKQVHPDRLDGLDYRPRHLRGGESVSLTITNDQWPEASR